MDNILNFIVKIKAQAQGLSSMVSSSTSQLDKIEKKANDVGKAIKEAFSFDKLKSDLTKIPGVSLLMNPYALIGAGVSAITSIGAEAEKTSVAFTTLVGSEEKAAEVLGRINEFAAKTPYNNINLTGNAKTMLAFGVETDKVSGYLQQLGDIAMGDQGKLDSLTRAFSKVISQGKLTGEVAQMFADSSFNVVRELSIMTGKSYSEMQDLMSKGKIGAEDMVAAINHATNGGAFTGMSEKLAETVEGKWSTLVGTIQLGAVDLFEKMKPFIKNIEDMFLALVPPVMEAFGTIFDWIGSLTGFIAEYGTELALVVGVLSSYKLFLLTTLAIEKGYAAFIAVKMALLNGYAGAVLIVQAATQGWTTLQEALNIVLGLNPIGIVVTAIAALTAGIIICWNRFAGFRAFLLTMWDVIKGLGGIIKDFVIDRFKAMIEGLGAIGTAIKKLFSGDFSGAAASAKEAVVKISGFEQIKNAATQTADLWNGSYARNLKEQRAIQAAKEAEKNKEAVVPGITDPSQKGSDGSYKLQGTGADSASSNGGKNGSKSANSAVTGGQRNTQITMSIGKFFDNIQVTMYDKADTAELQRTILQCLNRSLAMATTQDR